MIGERNFNNEKIHEEEHEPLRDTIKVGEDDENAFYLYYSGTIESGDLFGENYVNIKYDIHHGSNWEPIEIDKREAKETITGCTQAGCYNTLQNQEIVWNAPFSFGFKSTNLGGWP